MSADQGMTPGGIASAPPLRILFVEDIPEDFEIAVRELRKNGFEFEQLRVDAKEAFLAALSGFAPDIVISDYSMPRFDGMKALQLAREFAPDLPFIVLTGSKNEETAVQCLKAGAADYVIKSHIFRLPFAVREALEHARALAEREAAFRALRDSEANYRALADSGQALIWTDDTAKRCTYFNRTWLEFTGRSFEDEFGDGWLTGIHPEDRAQCLEVYDSAFARRDLFSIEFRLRRADGEYRWIQNNGSPRFANDGRFAGYIGHGLDITERKLIEQRLRGSLVERETLLRELFHRTRNNMQVIIAILALQEETTDSDSAKRIARDASARIMSMSLVHKKLYDSQNLSSIDLREYVEDLLELLTNSPDFPARRIWTEVDLEPIEANIDAAMPFGLILYELVANAFRYAYPDPATGVVRIGLRRLGEHRIELTVSDDGVGLPADGVKRQAKGLGLQLAQGLAKEQLGGSLTVATDRGLSCRVEFPEIVAMRRI